MLASIDIGVGQVVIIDNGGVVGELAPQHRVIRPGCNLGVSASWNLIMQTTPQAPWWVIVNHDVTFAPGDLARLAEHMESRNDGSGEVALLGTFSAFGVDRAAIDKAGWFDENFHPAYFEDNDFDYRCHLAGVPMTGLPAGLSHEISSTIRANKAYAQANGRTFVQNADYYQRKWGAGPRREKYHTPFDKGGDLRDWHLELDRVVRQSWT
jgi:GT2 family glycosyltransferase